MILATLLRSAREVISKSQTHINDPNLGDKGLSGDKVAADAEANFKASTMRRAGQRPSPPPQIKHNNDYFILLISPRETAQKHRRHNNQHGQSLVAGQVIF